MFLLPLNFLHKPACGTCNICSTKTHRIIRSQCVNSLSLSVKADLECEFVELFLCKFDCASFQDYHTHRLLISLLIKVEQLKTKDKEKMAQW